MPLKKAIENLKTAIDDLTSLHVQTYSGTIKMKLEPGKTPHDRFQVLQDKLGASNADVNLVLETLVRFDGDAYNFVADGASDSLRQVHNDAVAAGLNTRLGLITLAKDLID